MTTIRALSTARMMVGVLLGACSSAASTEVADGGPERDASLMGALSDAGTFCHPLTGLVRPLPECSPPAPCTRLAAEVSSAPIVSGSDPPACADVRGSERRSWTIGDSPTVRYVCVYHPIGAGTISRRPLVVWFHPGGDGADVFEQETHLLDKAAHFDLAADPARRGGHLAVVQGRNLHFPVTEPRDGRHHDFYFAISPSRRATLTSPAWTS